MELEDVRVTPRIVNAARLAHEVNKAYCEAIGDRSQVDWDKAEDWQQRSAIEGVRAIEAGIIESPGDSHVSWMKQKVADGWVYGLKKDAEKKTHHCMVPFNQLPLDQQVKDHLFLRAVRFMLNL